MKSILSPAAIVLMAVCLLLSCGKEGVSVDGPRAGMAVSVDSLQVIRQTLSGHIRRNEYGTALSLGESVKSYGAENDDPELYLTGIVYLSQTYYGLQQADSMNLYLDEAIELGLKQEDWWALAAAHNLQGIYSMNIELDFPKGFAHLIESVKYAELSGEDSYLFPPKMNLAIGYYLRDDAAGLPHARDVYELGQKLDDPYMIFSGAVSLGYLYHMSGEYDKALEYIGEAIPLTETYGDRSGVYSKYGDILLAKGREAEAVEAYLHALADESFKGHYSSAIDPHLSYGAYLMGKKRYDEAVRIIEQADGIVHKENNPVKRYLLYRDISAAYESIGKTESALSYYKMYHAEQDSIFSAVKERSVGELKVQYEKERHANEVQQHEIDRLSWQKRLQIAIMLLVVILIIAVVGYLLNYRTDKNYKHTLKQHLESKEKERWYQQQLEKATGQAGEKTEYPKSRSSDKMEELFANLQEIMRSQQLYRDTELSRDKAARILSTNRTYLTEVISKFTGLSFIYYVNSFRIDEAIRILSDPENDTPIKALASEAGFSTLSTFYKFFQAATGMSPAQFRDQVKSRP